MTDTDDTPQKWSIGEVLHALVDRVLGSGWEAAHAHAGVDDAFPDTTPAAPEAPAAPAAPDTTPAAPEAPPAPTYQ